MSGETSSFETGGNVKRHRSCSTNNKFYRCLKFVQLSWQQPSLVTIDDERNVHRHVKPLPTIRFFSIQNIFGLEVFKKQYIYIINIRRVQSINKIFIPASPLLCHFRCGAYESGSRRDVKEISFISRISFSRAGCL